MDRLIASLLAIAFPIFSIWLLGRSAVERAKFIAGQGIVMTFSRAWRVWVAVVTAIFAIGFLSDVLLGKVGEDEQLSFWLGFVSFGFLFVLANWFVNSYRVEYDDRQISVTCPTRPRRVILWSSVISARAEKGDGIVIQVRDEKHQVIVSLITGTSEFLARAQNLAGNA